VALPQQAGRPLPTILAPPHQRFSHFSHSWRVDLIFGVLMLVALIVVLLIVFQPVRHAVITPPAATPATTPAAHQGVSLLSPTAFTPNSAIYCAAGLLAVLTGVVQLAMGVARLGILVNFVSDAVIVGFAAGAGGN
jgi:MFS superfamily sulfate permease-like transporter